MTESVSYTHLDVYKRQEQIINYRDIPTDKRIDIVNALERIGFFPAYGGVKTMQQIIDVYKRQAVSWRICRNP